MSGLYVGYLQRKSHSFAAAIPPIRLARHLVFYDQAPPSGDSLNDAIARTDESAAGYPAYCMINCAHPTHFYQVLHGAVWNRIRSLRVNASRRSNAELDESTDLDAGDPGERGDQHALLREHLAKLTVVGGRCGTDHRQGGAMLASLQGASAR